MMDILVAILELGNLKCALAHCASPRSAHTVATWRIRPRPAHVVCGDAHNHVVLLVAARYSDADQCTILGECDSTVADIANLLQIDGDQFKIEMVQDVVLVRAPAARRHAMSRSDTCNLEHMRQWLGRVVATWTPLSRRRTSHAAGGGRAHGQEAQQDKSHAGARLHLPHGLQQHLPRHCAALQPGPSKRVLVSAAPAPSAIGSCLLTLIAAQKRC